MARADGELSTTQPSGHLRTAVIRALVDEIETAGRLVGVDGVDGAGKTTLAEELAAELRSRDLGVVRVSVDGFHNPSDVRHRRGRDDPEGFFRDSYDYERLVSLALEPLARRAGTYVPAVYDVQAPDPAHPSNRRYVEGQRIYIRECEPASRATVVVDDGDLAAPVLLRRT